MRARYAQNAVVEYARPLLNKHFAAKKISKEEYKTLLKRIGEKVVEAHRAKSARPPKHLALSDEHKASIKKLVGEYVHWVRKQAQHAGAGAEG